MHHHDPLTVLMVDDHENASLAWFEAYLERMPHLSVVKKSHIPSDLSDGQVLLSALETMTDDAIARAAAFVAAGGGWLHMVGPDVQRLPDCFGVQPEPPGPHCELRVLFSDSQHPLAVRLPDAIYVQERFRSLALEAADAETILYTDWHFEHRAVLVQRPVGDGKIVCTTLSDVRHDVLCQIWYRLLRSLGGLDVAAPAVGIGILGYAPSVGQYHGQGVVQTEGLMLKAACDLSPERLHQAQQDFQDIGVHGTSEALADDPDVDLVIIATPPNTHADLALQMLAAGKHVICEKPLALKREETEAMARAATEQGLHLSCHQNRRWDVDYMAIREALASDLIGELFYLETFVGGFSHPCGYWHSDAIVSGGMTYDWGAHYIDWIVGLVPSVSIRSVIGTRHKRVWHDVTNADQERIQIRFEDGLEAEFIHSDIAAARKPKWYLLGTQGAIVGDWHDVTEYQIDPVHYFQQHDIPATEMPPELTLHRRIGSQKQNITELALPDRPVFGFHMNLADHLLTGEPMVAPLKDSMRVVAVLEAAAASMDAGGKEEVVNV